MTIYRSSRLLGMRNFAQQQKQRREADKFQKAHQWSVVKMTLRQVA